MVLSDDNAGRAILDWLASDGPHPDIPPEDRLFAPLVGSWDLDVEWFEDGTLAKVERGEWHFAWVLEGRAIQDVWIVPPVRERRHDGHDYEYGTSIRFHDPALGGWRSIWVGPTRKSTEMFVARRVGTEIVLETRRADGHAMRWVFSGVRADSFVWQNFLQRDNNEWELTQRFYARRRQSQDEMVARATP